MEYTKFNISIPRGADSKGILHFDQKWIPNPIPFPQFTSVAELDLPTSQHKVIALHSYSWSFASVTGIGQQKIFSFFLQKSESSYSI